MNDLEPKTSLAHNDCQKGHSCQNGKVILPEPSSNSLLLRQKIHRYVKNVNNAQTHDDWHLIDIEKKQLGQLLYSNDWALSNTCQELSRLPDKDLLLFYDNIFAWHAKGIRPNCLHSLQKRIHIYFANARRNLSLNAKDIAKTILTPCSDRQSNTFGPAEDIFVDSRQGGRIFGTNFEDCKIAFTFDDGPHHQLTPKLLESLDNDNLQATFFVVGNNATRLRNILRATHAKGHLIGNHSMTHSDMREQNFNVAKSEIENNFSLITELVQEYLPFFRFPYGASTSNLRQYLNDTQRVEFLWNIDTLDWRIRNPEDLYTYSLQVINSERRGIVLMHDIQPQTIEVVPFLFEALREAGYQPVIIRPLEAH